VTFLDPYSKDRRMPLVLLARFLMLAVVALLAWLAWDMLDG